MNIITKALCFLSLATAGQGQHHAPPPELDVTSPVFCSVDASTGFGPSGLVLEDEKNVTFAFNYAVKYTGGTLDEVIAASESRIAGFLLTETSLVDGCGPSSRRAQAILKSELRGFGTRKLQSAKVLGVSTSPLDEDTELECTTPLIAPPEPGQSCAIVDGAFTIIFADDAVDTTSTEEQIATDLQTAMDLGKFDGEFEGGEINSMSLVDLSSISNAPPVDATEGEVISTEPEETDRNGSTPVIVGASVAGLLAIGLIAFYQRRNLKSTDDETLTTGPPGNTVA